MPADRVDIRLVGPFAVRVGGLEVPPAAFGSGLARKLLRLLAVAQGEGLSRDALAEALWGAARPADPDGNLAVHVSRIRRALGIPHAVTTTTNGYALADPPAVVVDVHECLRLVADARAAAIRGDHRTARTHYRAVLDHSTGDVLPEDDGLEITTLRASVARARLEALDGAARLAIDAAESVELAQQAVGSAPLHEPSHLLLVTALARSGDRPGALAAWDRMRQLLADELGLDPSTEAQQLQAAVLRDELRPATPWPSAVWDLPLVDRDVELADLRDLLRGPPTRIGVVVGPAGAGKSRLLSECTSGVDRPVFALRAFLAERHEPWALVRHLVETVVEQAPNAADALAPVDRSALAELLPEETAVTGPDRVALESETRHAMRREACIHLLRAVPGSVLVVDDLQWADATSVEVLTHLADRHVHDAVLLAIRPDEVAPGTVVAGLLDHFDRVQAPRRFDLQPLSRAALEELAGDAALAKALADHTDRTPFAVSEVLDHLVRRGLLDPREAGPAGCLPASVIDTAVEVARQGRTAAVASRVRARPAVERTLVRLLALLAREAPVALLAHAVGRTEDETLDALDGLHRAGLVRRAAAGWAPSHDLVGEAVSGDVDPAERVRLHRLLAAGLRAHEADAAEVAAHLERAGDPAAVEAYVTAVRDRFARHAHREARDLADRALALDPSDDLVRADLLELRGEARHRLGELAEGRSDLRAALTLHRSPTDRSRILATMAMAASGAEDIDHARELAELALVAAGERPAARARALSVASIIDFNTGRPGRADQRAGEALDLYRRLGDTTGVADILDGRAMAAFLDGRITAAIEAFDRVAMLFVDAGDLFRVVTPRSTRGHGLVFAGRPEEGLVDIAAALATADQLGNQEGRAYCLWHRAEALALLGHVDEAAASAEEALSVASAIDHRGWTATAHLAIGIARHAAGDLTGAVEAFDACLSLARLGLFTAWANARAALCEVAGGRLDDAERRVAVALRAGPGLSGFLARHARVEVAAARGDSDTSALAAAALEQAELHGWGQLTDRLRELAAR